VSNCQVRSCKQSKLKCICMNARSVVNKIKELKLLVEEENVDVVAITETWLNETITDEEMNISGFVLFRRDRNDPIKRRGGGVAMYIKNELNPVYNCELSEDSFSESLWCNIICENENTLLGVCYRAPDSSELNDEKLYGLINSISKYRVVVMGDFNLPELDWGNLDNLDLHDPFVDCLLNNFLLQLVDEPTRGNNYLDLVLSSEENMVQNLSVGEQFETSDHQVIRFDLVCRKNENKTTIKKYDYFRADYDEVRKHMQALQQETSSNYFTNNISEVNDRWINIKNNCLRIRNKYIGPKRKAKNKSKWATNKVRKCRREKKKAWMKFIKGNRDEKLYKEYKIKLNNSVKENRRAKRSFEERLAKNIKEDSKTFFAYVNSKKRSNNMIGPLKNSQGEVLKNNKETADLLNSYFASVFTREDCIHIPEPVEMFKGSQSESLSSMTIEEQVVLEKLTKINVGKSHGPDELHGKLLYEIRYEIVKDLTKLFNLSLETGVVPQDWRDADVCPLFKKGKRDKAENYRPVSLTSIVGKLLESILKDRIVTHLEQHKLLRESQHGFTSGRSCLTNLLVFFEFITKELDKGNNVDLVYLDFCKAFDKVPHCRLGKKLEAHGIKGEVKTWIVNWLSNRRQRVCVDGELSDWEKVSSGVPQGSVLGPVLFLIYINDLDEGVISEIGKFADDSKLGKSISSSADIRLLEDDLSKLEDWSVKWQMLFNVDKCSIMHLGKSNANHLYKIGNNMLKYSDKERDLGVIVDKTLKFSEQVNSVVCKANATLGMIRRNITCKNKFIVTRLYKALVRPKLEYCVQAWRPYLRKDIHKIEQVQGRATRMIEECRGLGYEERLKVTGLTTLEKRRTRGDLIEVFKAVKGITKIDRSSLFTIANNSRTRGHRFKLVKTRSRLDLRKNFFSQRVVNDWNSLPEAVVEANSVNSFKNLYDKYVQK
jgi:ribonuclease P/MRP protein subunit RPP40